MYFSMFLIIKSYIMVWWIITILEIGCFGIPIGSQAYFMRLMQEKGIV
jgi:hypothetical protein